MVGAARRIMIEGKMSSAMTGVRDTGCCGPGHGGGDAGCGGGGVWVIVGEVA